MSKFFVFDNLQYEFAWEKKKCWNIPLNERETFSVYRDLCVRRSM